MKAPVSLAVAVITFLIGVTLLAFLLLALRVEWASIIGIGETYREYGNTRNIERNPYVMIVPVIVGVLIILAISSDRIENYLKKKFKKKLK